MRTDDSRPPGAPARAGAEEPPAGARPAAEPEPTPAEARFRNCRWSARGEGAAYCSNPEVLPYAGKRGFNAEAWCLDCAFYKPRRKTSKRPRDGGDLL